MSDFKQYCDEKEKIDELLAQGYVISAVKENLSGAFVQFSPGESSTHREQVKELHILTADARKYFSNLMLAQQGKVPNHS